MPAGPGALDAEGVWQFGEDDDEGGLASDMLNLLAESTSVQLAVDRSRLTTAEADIAALETAAANSGPIVPTLSNSWVNDFGLAYWKIAGVTYLRGRLSGGTSSTAFTLPTGFRPSSAARWLVAQATGTTPALVVVNTDGTVVLTSGTTPYLNSINFPSV